MIAYLVLGIGILLVLVSVIYTYSVDRKVSKIPDNLENISVSQLYDDGQDRNRNKTAPEPEDQQLKNSINTIGGELDELIQELRGKEQEIKNIVNKARKWNFELSDPIFAELLEKKMNYQESNHFVQRLYKEQAAVSSELQAKEKLLESETELETEIESKEDSVQNITPGKYDKIKELTEQGLAIAEIARQLSMGYREVELVVKMSKKGATPDA